MSHRQCPTGPFLEIFVKQRYYCKQATAIIDTYNARIHPGSASSATILGMLRNICVQITTSIKQMPSHLPKVVVFSNALLLFYAVFTSPLPADMFLSHFILWIQIIRSSFLLPDWRPSNLVGPGASGPWADGRH